MYHCHTSGSPTPPPYCSGLAGTHHSYLLRVSLGLQARLEPPQQGRTVPRQPLKQPVAVGSLHKLLLPLNGHLVRDPV